MGGNHFRETRGEWEEHERKLKRHSIMKEPSVGHHSQMLSHFCKKDTMHICLACSNGDRQRNCAFHIPSSGGNHCMELRFEQFCANQVLHQYVDGRMSDRRANSLVVGEKKRIAEINNRAEGYHVDFPLEGEETIDNVQNVYEQLAQLGMTTPEFWVDDKGKSATEYDSFYVSIGDIRAGKWRPKKKELTKDILKYLEIREKLKL